MIFNFSKTQNLASCYSHFLILFSSSCWFPHFHLGRAKRIWYLSPMRVAKVQASLRIRAVAPEPPLLAQTSSESRGTFNQKARSLVPLGGWACAIKICHDRMLEDTNSLDSAHFPSDVTKHHLVTGIRASDTKIPNLTPCLSVFYIIKQIYWNLSLLWLSIT